jgi:NAD(P)-dependent dehydrogenase (short-subunit alcohol dehydrogenase family)
MTYCASPRDGVAWVTGAGTGIGKAVAIELSRRGFKVIITGRRRDVLENVVRENADVQMIAYPGDVSDAQNMQDIVAGVEALHGPIALAFLNAGVAPYVRAEAIDLEAFRQSYAINVMGAVNALAPLFERMNLRGKGQVAVNASVAGYGGLPQAAAYGSSKAAVIHLCEALKFDCDRMGITLQLVNPGFVDTPLTQKNDFPMPFMISIEEAASRICDGFIKGGFEITFPRRLSMILKLVNLLPYSIYFPLVGWATGWSKK